MIIKLEGKEQIAIGKQNIASIVVSAINFSQYSKCYDERSREMNKTLSDVLATKAFLRARRNLQVKAFDEKGAAVVLDTTLILQLPRSIFVRINDALDEDNGLPGEIISKGGDGLDIPIIYKLGSPFSFKSDDSEKIIEELEFIAKTGGDIEEVLCGTTSIDQTISLIRCCATPIGGDSGLQTLPSWMLDNLTLADGIEIMQKVLPIFV